MAKRKPITPIYPYDPLEKYRNDEPKNTPKAKPDDKSSRLLFIVLCMTLFATICTLILFTIVFTQMMDIMASRKEYASIRKATESTESEDTRSISAFDLEMRQINPEYLCWLKIEGKAIDYPVARGDDNEKYLSLSFSGEENVHGSLFMDYRCTGEYVPHIIIYGHNTKTGDMFGGLRKFLDEQYREEHHVITLTINDRLVEYEIFSARKTDINDLAYYLDFSAPGTFKTFAERCGAPPDATQIITLSTCVSGDDKDERVVVQGVLR